MVHLPELNTCRSERRKRSNDRVVDQRLNKMFRKRCIASGHIRKLIRAPRKHTNKNSIINLILEQEPTLGKLLLKSNNSSFLWIAVLGYYYQSAELLVRSGADVNELYGGQDSQLIDEKWTVLHMLLHMEASSKNAKLIRLIADHGANLQARDSKGRTVLHTAVTEDRVDVIEMLIRKGADLQARDFKGQTALHIAVTEDRVQMIELLLEKGADINVADDKGVTPLLEAASSSKANELVPLLMNHGADVIVKDTDGENVLHKLSRAPVEHVDLTRAFIEMGFFSLEDRESHYQRQLIHLAAMMGNNELLKLYLNHGANVNAQMKHGFFPLYLAAVNGKPAVMKTLLEHGANVDQKTTHEGRTALHNACENLIVVAEDFQEENIRLLLSAGANVLIEDRNGKTPFALINPHYYMRKPGTWLILKNLALIRVCQPTIELKDERIIEQHTILRNYYKDCIEQLERTKSTRFIKTCTFFDLLAKCRCQIAELMRNLEFEINFKNYDLTEFPMYAEDIVRAFERAKKHYQSVLEQENVANETFYNILPYLVVRRIVSYICNCC